MGYLLLSVLLACSMVLFLLQQNALERRIAAQKNVPREALIPRHYKSFTDLENRLWATVQERNRKCDLEHARFGARDPEFQVIRDYVRRVREDFRKAHNIWGQVILHSPEAQLFLQLEWERIRVEFVYYRWWLSSGLRLRTVGISIGELRQLTEIVATAAYRVRTLLGVFENGGHGEFVDSILRQS